MPGEKNAKIGRTRDREINAWNFRMNGILLHASEICVPQILLIDDTREYVRPFSRRSIGKAKCARKKQHGRYVFVCVTGSCKIETERGEKKAKKRNVVRMPSVPTYEFLSMANLCLRKWSRQGAWKEIQQILRMRLFRQRVDAFFELVSPFPSDLPSYNFLSIFVSFMAISYFCECDDEMEIENRLIYQIL